MYIVNNVERGKTDRGNSLTVKGTDSMVILLWSLKMRTPRKYCSFYGLQAVDTSGSPLPCTSLKWTHDSCLPA